MDIYGHLLPLADQRATSHFDKFFKNENEIMIWAHFGHKFILYGLLYKNKKPRNR